MTLEQMRKRKKQLGYSNAELSNMTGIPLGTLNKILSGATKKPSPESIKAIEQVLQDTTYQYGYASAAPYMLHEEAVEYREGEQREKRPGEFTIDDYYALPEDKRVELIDGVFYDMAAPSVRHQLIAGSVYAQFLSYIRRKKGQCLPLVSPVDVKLDADNKTMVQPDVIVICDRSRVQERLVEGGPDFVLEVVSPSSTSRDYVRKAAKYIESGVREYWIIDPMKERVLTYDFTEDGVPVIRPLGGQIPVAIYNGDLLIDLDEYKLFLKDDEEQG